MEEGATWLNFMPVEQYSHLIPGVSKISLEISADVSLTKRVPYGHLSKSEGGTRSLSLRWD